jgi:hypothetical protein
MVKFAAISVPIEVKKQLALMKGNKSWGKYLAETLAAIEQSQQETRERAK